MSKKITPLNAHGMKVVEFSDWLIKRGKTIRDNKPCCEHKSIVYDTDERRIQCENCGTDLDPFDVVMDKANKLLNRGDR
jgi:ribosomal protein S27E